MLDNAQARASMAKIVEPIARGLLRIGLTPDMVTWIGALAVVANSVFVIAHGHWVLGALLYGLLGLSDVLDGTMARLSQTSGKWGAFLDSTLDRIVDASVLIAIAVYYIAHPEQSWIPVVTLIALTAGQLTSYIRARAEAVGATCRVGFAERAERSLIVWLGMLLTGLGFNVLPYSLVLLALASSATVIQRIIHVRKQLV
jgi:CDP-diacylglycerol--glycerol-3-phosphate 3-phosphatidyltransferase